MKNKHAFIKGYLFFKGIVRKRVGKIYCHLAPGIWASLHPQ
jgi:hypothetical protein